MVARSSSPFKRSVAVLDTRPSSDHPLLDDPRVVALVERHATLLSNKLRDRAVDRDDARQLLLAELVDAEPRYDPSVAKPVAYAIGVIVRASRDACRKRMADKRGALVTDAGVDLGKVADSRSDVAGSIARLDVHSALERLSDEERAIAEAVVSTASVSEAARREKVSRTSVYTVLARMRTRLDGYGVAASGEVA